MRLENDQTDEPINLRSRQRESAEMDITPMIDVVFLLLIFFVVCSTIGKNTSVHLPKAKIGVAVNPKTATVLTVDGLEDESIVYLGDGTSGRRLSHDPEQLREQIVQAVELGVREGKVNVVIKADKNLNHGEVYRVESAAGSVPGVKLNIVVDKE